MSDVWISRDTEGGMATWSGGEPRIDEFGEWHGEALILMDCETRELFGVSPCGLQAGECRRFRLELREDTGAASTEV